MNSPRQEWLTTFESERLIAGIRYTFTAQVDAFSRDERLVKTNKKTGEQTIIKLAR